MMASSKGRRLFHPDEPVAPSQRLSHFAKDFFGALQILLSCTLIIH